MRLNLRHSWDLSPSAAVELQKCLRARLIDADPPLLTAGTLRRVAGVDVGFPARDRGRTARAAVAVLSFPALEVMETAVVQRPTRFPYVPGLLSFREVPVILDALAQLSCLPELVLCDGQGRAHPRGFGLACHLGLTLDLPTIGVAKTRLFGHHGAVPERRGEWTPLRAGKAASDAVIGAVLRSRAGTKPLYVSAGHRISLTTAVGTVMACVGRYRLPETTRVADRLASGRC